MAQIWTRKQQTQNKSQFADNVDALAICWDRIETKLFKHGRPILADPEIIIFMFQTFRKWIDHALSPWPPVEPLPARLVRWDFNRPLSPCPLASWLPARIWPIPLFWIILRHCLAIVRSSTLRFTISNLRNFPNVTFLTSVSISCSPGVLLPSSHHLLRMCVLHTPGIWSPVDLASFKWLRSLFCLSSASGIS